MCKETDTNSVKRFLAIAFFGIAFGYIEATVMVYLRAIFYPDGFVFPITNFGDMPGAMRFLLTEIGREVATLLLIFATCYMLGRNWRRRLAYFMIIFAIWDVFYYAWLKLLLDWPVSVTDWDVLFLMPVAWAGPVLAPIVTSAIMLVIAAVLLSAQPIKVSKYAEKALAFCLVMIAACFCVAGLKIDEPIYRFYFSWEIFLILHASVLYLFLRCIRKGRFEQTGNDVEKSEKAD
jgi:hypothetical protein